MAIGTIVEVGPTADESKVQPLGLLAPGSAPGLWRTLLDDATAAVQNAAALLNPIGVTSSNCHWTRITKPYGKLGALWLKVPIAITTISASPIVRLYTGHGKIATGNAPAADGTFRVLRLGTADYTLTYQASPSTSNSMNDGTYWYFPASISTPLDLLGADYLFCALQTNCTLSSVLGAPVEGLFVN